MRLLLNFMCAGITMWCHAQAPNIDWQKSYGGSDFDRPRSVINVSTGGFMVASNTSSTDGDLADNVLGRNVWLLRLDEQGEMLWQNWYGSIHTASSALQVRETPDGGFVVVTTIGVNAPGVLCATTSVEGWIFKVDAAGDLQWERCMGGSGGDSFRSIELTNDGGFIIAGGSSSPDGDLPGNKGQADIWVVKLDGNGAIQWSRNYGGSGSEGASHAIQMSTGGFLVSGAGRSSDQTFAECNPYFPSNNTAFFLKLDDLGEVVWAKCYGGNGDDTINKLAEGAGGIFWAAGTTYSLDGDVTGHHGALDGWILKLDSSGALVGNYVYGGSADDYIYDIQIVPNGNALLLGYTNSVDGDINSNFGLFDAWVIQVDQELNLTWQRTYGGSAHDLGRSITLSPDGGAFFCATSSSIDGDVTLPNGPSDAWLVKLEPWVVGVEEAPHPTDLRLFPNPATDMLKIQLKEGSAGSELEIFDAVGRSVQRTTVHASPMVVPVEELTPGMYTVTLSAKAGDVVGYGRFIKL
jgi:hypothetical protein